ncbi:MAG: transglutaminase-like domain-containing protein [Bacteroidales bacterium]|nr:transglutaminase-like domain-containing protein [Bacteroidales bacterium]
MLTDTQNNELNALINLLDEPDESIYNNIEKKLFSYGSDAIYFLEDALQNSFNDLIHKRIENIIHKIRLEKTADELKTWSENGENDLLEGFILASKYQYPDLEKEVILKKLGKIVRDAWLELNNELTALEKIKVINHIIFKVHGFKGNKNDFYASEDYFINNLLNSKIGNHLSLGILYIIIAKRLDIPIFGIDLPKQFILSYVDNGNSFFYLNPFNKGIVFPKNEVEVYIKHLKLEAKPSYFLPCENKRIIERLFEGLFSSYNNLGYLDKAGEVKYLLDQID